MSKVESTWSLHCNNATTPKSLAVYPTPPVPIPSMRSSGSGGNLNLTSSSSTTASSNRDRMSTNPFDTRVRNPFGSAPTNTPTGGAGAGAGGNPFDVATSSSTSPSSFTSSNAAFAMPSNISYPTSSSSSSSSSIMKTTYSVLYGTDRGTLHYRTYPINTNNKLRSNKMGSVSMNNNNNNNNTSNHTAIAPVGLENPNNAAGSSGSGVVNLHPVYQPLDIMSPVLPVNQGQQQQQRRTENSIVICLRAEPPSYYSSIKKGFNNNNYNMKAKNNINDPYIHNSSQQQQQHECHNPIFLLLQDDKDNFDTLRNSSRSSLHSTTNNHHEESVASRNSIHDDVSTKTYAANLITLHQYDHYNFHQHQHNKVSSVVSVLPRMSSVSYHEMTGYVYSIGSSIYSIPPKAALNVSSAFVNGWDPNINMNLVHNNNNPSTVATTIAMKYLPKFYYHCTNVLPSCGVRSGYGGLSVICNGHVVVVAMKNGSFYAVNGMSVNERFWLTSSSTTATTSPSPSSDMKENENKYGQESKGDVEKILTFRQSSPVHPTISIEIPLSSASSSNYSSENNNYYNNTKDDNDDTNNDVHTSLVFLASGRECAVVEIMYNPKLYSNNRHARMMNQGIGGTSNSEDDIMQSSLLPSPSMSGGSIVIGSPRHGIATLASPILAAVGLKPYTSHTSPTTTTRDGVNLLSSSSSSSSSCTPLVVILTSDGLVHTRSPSFISIPLSTIEVGNRPNDFFTLQALPNRKVVVGSYSGEARLLSFREDTMQDLADRLVKLSIDAFGSNGFPRAELAEATGATFSATSYVGAEPSVGARNMLKQYLETCLGLDMSGDFGGAALYKQFLYGEGFDVGDDENNYGESQSIALASPFAASYLSATAILCLVCTRLGSPNPSLANRAAKSGASKFGMVGRIQQTGINASTVKVCELVAETLLDRSESKRTVPATGGLATGRDGIQMEMVEAASWLLRACGQHEQSIEILQKRMNNPTTRNKMFVEDGTDVAGDKTFTKYAAGWSQSKYDKHLCSHLEELWSSGDKVCQDLVLKSDATRQLLETNSALGLRIFTSHLPQNEKQWILTIVDPLIDTTKTSDVVELMKSIVPIAKIRKSKIDVGSMSIEVNNDFELPLESGRALAVSYLETGIGIATGRPQMKSSDDSDDILVDIHNELAFLLLEGVLTERIDGDGDADSDLGKMYREKLRRLLGWHSSRVQPDQIMDALPKSFLREKALLYGQLGRHEDALTIFYLDLKSLDLALEYCDARYEKQQAQHRYQIMKAHSSGNSAVKICYGCAYLPLVRVALEADKDSERGIAAAIQVLSLRRDNIDRAAALRLLPKNIPVSAIARSFLIPALIDGESQARRLTVTASLLRAKYNRLKYSLTEAQIKSQAILQNVPALQSLNLGQAAYVSNSFKARPSNMSSLHFPEVIITKHFFQRYVVIQATATTVNGMTLGDLKLVVAESSDEAVLPSLNVPIKTLPPRITGSSWCVLAASPQRLDGTAILVCEMHYNILSYDGSSSSYHFDNGLQNGPSGRSHVEEIQDIEIRRAEFEG